MSVSEGARRRARRTRAAAWIAGLFVAALATWMTRAWGPGRAGEWDSANYIDGARHLALARGYMTSRGALGVAGGAHSPITLWPPGFSLLMVPAIWAGATPAGAASLVLGASYVAVVTLIFALGCEVAGARSWPVALPLCLAFALEPHTLEALGAILSDLPFAAVACLSLLMVLRLLRPRRARPIAQIAAGLALASTFLVRYAGAGIIVGAVLGLLASRRGPMLLRVRAFFPMLVSLFVPDAAWLARNWLSSGEPVGLRQTHTESIVKQTRLALDGSFAWIADAEKIARTVHLPVFIHQGAFVSVAGLALLGYRTGAFRSARVRVVAFAALGYVATMLVVGMTAEFDGLGELRFWVPAWPLTAVLAVALMGRARRARSRLLVAPPLVLALTCAYLFGLDARPALATSQAPRHLMTAAWKQFATLIPPDDRCELVANEVRPFLLYRSLARSARIPTTMPEMEALIGSHGPLCLLFVKARIPRTAAKARPRQLELIEELTRGHRLQRIARTQIADLYRIIP